VFAPHQIVCLACDQTLLYGEVIQVLEDRQMCWVRPLVLVDEQQSTDANVSSFGPGSKQHLQPVIDGPDLLWPLSYFQPALDTDVIPVLTAVRTTKLTEKTSRQTANQRLRQFMEKLWARQSAADYYD
jgi:hypothetical protein